MNGPPPAIELVEPAGDAKRWSIELRHFSKFDQLLGRDVLNAFSRCFVHVDRLTSTASCIYASQQCHGRDSVAYERDLTTMVWFSIGTLRELAKAIQALRVALAQRGRLESASKPWITLRGLEDRWERNAFYRKKRDKGAFHVDDDVIDKGLSELIRDETVVTLSVSDGSKAVENRFVLGLRALHKGLDLDGDDLRQFLEGVRDDHVAAASAIQEAFISAARASGVRRGRVAKDKRAEHRRH